MNLHIENTMAQLDSTEKLRFAEKTNSKKVVDGLNKEIQSLELKMKDYERSHKPSQKVREY